MRQFLGIDLLSIAPAILRRWAREARPWDPIRSGRRALGALS